MQVFIRKSLFPQPTLTPFWFYFGVFTAVQHYLLAKVSQKADSIISKSHINMELWKCITASAEGGWGRLNVKWLRLGVKWLDSVRDLRILWELIGLHVGTVPMSAVEEWMKQIWGKQNGQMSGRCTWLALSATVLVSLAVGTGPIVSVAEEWMKLTETEGNTVVIWVDIVLSLHFPWQSCVRRVNETGLCWVFFFLFIPGGKF